MRGCLVLVAQLRFVLQAQLQAAGAEEEAEADAMGEQTLDQADSMMQCTGQVSVQVVVVA